jgi:hypothetical protein
MGVAMGLNDIVVYVDGAEAAKTRVGFAVALAKQHGAHLIGVAFAPTTLLPLSGADVGFADMTEVLESVKAQGSTALNAFNKHAAGEGVTCEARLMQGMRGVSERFRLCRAACRHHHSRPTARRRPADRPICAGRTLPVRIGPSGHDSAGGRAEAWPGRHHRRSVGRKR